MKWIEVLTNQIAAALLVFALIASAAFHRTLPHLDMLGRLSQVLR
jgi:hypothetical protein